MNEQVKVWTVLIRLFHWLLVALFIFAFISEDEFDDLHFLSGYSILFLLVFRIFYGFFGNKYARFSGFIYSPRAVINYIKSVFSFDAKRYLGHNPAGGVMVLVIIMALFATIFTGMVALPYEDRPAELSSIFSVLPYWFLSEAEELHELFADFSLFLVVVHITGVLIESVLHQENLIRSMLTGRKNSNTDF